MINMKDEIGVIGMDDAPFKKEDDKVILIGTYFRGNKIIDGIYFKKTRETVMTPLKRLSRLLRASTTRK